MRLPSRRSFVLGAAAGLVAGAGGATLLLRRPGDTALAPTSRIGRRIPFGICLPQLTAYPRHTWHVAMSVAGAFTAVRVIFANTTDQPVPIDAVAVATSNSGDALLHPSGPGARWHTVTFGGRANGIMPANTSEDRLGNPSYFLSDWVPLPSEPRDDGSSFPIIMARTYLSTTGIIPAAGTGRAPGQGWRSDSGDRMLYAGFFAPGDWVTSRQDGFPNPQEPGSMPIVGFEFALEKPGVTVALFGDSITGGEMAELTYNSWAARAAVEASGPELCVNHDNMGWGGQGLPQIYGRWQRYLAAGFRPGIALWQGSSPNGFMAVEDQVALARFYAGQFLLDCDQHGIVPLIASQAPRDDYDAGAERIRRATNSALAELAPTIALDPVWAGGAGFRQGLSDDGIHPNEAGNAAAVAPLLAALHPLLTR